MPRHGRETLASPSRSYPQAGDPSVSVKGQVQTTGTRTYQARYRNAFPACVPDLFNLTNAIEIVWQP